jgi:hypothetical protein
MKLQVKGFKANKKQLEVVGEPMKEVLLHEDDAAELNKHKYNTLIEYVKI